MTRSLSNLIKSVYFHVKEDGTRVIDSDSQVTQFVPELFQMQQEELTDLQGMGEHDEEAAEFPDTFQEGLQVLNIDDVRQEEREKIEQEAYEQLQMMQEQARQEADELLENARKEAEVMRRNAYEQGKAQGFAEGQGMAAKQLQEQQAQLQRQMEQKERELQEEQLALEPKFADIMASLIEKITGVLCQDKKEVIVYLIHQALNQLEKTGQVTLRISKADMLMVSAHRDELRGCLADGVDLHIAEDASLGVDQCIIETDSRMLDCSLDVQLQNVKDQIRMLMVM